MLMDMLDILMLLLDMPPTAHLPAPALLVLPLLLSQLLLVDMPVLDVMLLTLLVLFMLQSVKLRLKLTQLSSMELMDMLVLDTLAMLDMLDILMLMDMLDILMLLLDMLPTAHLPAPALLVLPLLLSQLLLVDMPVLGVMLPTLLELFMLPKNFNFKVVFVGSSPYLNIFQFLSKKQ